MFGIFFSILIGLLILVIVGGLIIFSYNRLYCFVFEHQEYKLWEAIIGNYDAIHLDMYENDGSYAVFTFNYGTPLKLILWNQTTSSVHEHDFSDCILSEFDKYHSRKLAKILVDVYEREKGTPMPGKYTYL